MNWRTDTPTADIIVVFLKGSCYPQVLEYDKEKQCYLEEHNSPVNIQNIEKWADLEEDENGVEVTDFCQPIAKEIPDVVDECIYEKTVTDCNELEEEIAHYIHQILTGKNDSFTKSAVSALIDYCARHFAKWGAEHLKPNRNEK